LNELNILQQADGERKLTFNLQLEDNRTVQLNDNNNSLSGATQLSQSPPSEVISNVIENPNLVFRQTTIWQYGEFQKQFDSVLKTLDQLKNKT
jgi:hypothetical protein